MPKYVYNIPSLNVIFSDGSGNPGLGKSQKENFFVIGFCHFKYTSPLIDLEKLLKKLKRHHQYPPHLNEIKFSPGPPEKHFHQMRIEITQILLKNVNKVFAGVIDKSALSNDPWTPKHITNYLFTQSLKDYVFPNLGCVNIPSIVNDVGLLSNPLTPELISGIKTAVQNTWPDASKSYDPTDSVLFKDSLQTWGIWASDFVAGAFHHMLRHGDSTFTDILKPKFIKKGYHTFTLDD